MANSRDYFVAAPTKDDNHNQRISIHEKCEKNLRADIFSKMLDKLFVGCHIHALFGQSVSADKTN